MKKIKLFEEFVTEGMIRKNRISDNYLDDKEELTDTNMVQDFFTYHGINPLAVDIYKYMISTYKQYPRVVMSHAMKYDNIADGDDVIVTFKKGEIGLEKQRRTLNSNGHSFSDNTMEKGKFSWKLLNKIVKDPS